MSFFNRMKSMPQSLIEPTPKTSGNAASGYTSFQHTDRLVEERRRRMGYPPFLSGELEEVAETPPP